MSAASPVRVACLGAGYFSQYHLRSWQRMENARCIAIADRDIARARSTGLPAYDNLSDMLAAHGPELLDIIVPPSGHAQAIRTALDHGVRWIVCQKPFCMTPKEARAVTDEAEAVGTTLVVHENFRFQPWYRTIKALLDAGRIGAVQQATFRFRPGDGQGPRAYLDRQPYFREMPRFLVHETAVHWVDTFRYLFGDPVAVYADLRRVNPMIAGEDAGVILFDHPRGVRALFDGNRHLDHAADNLRRTMGDALIEGDDGAITFGGDGAVHLRRFGSIATAEVLSPDTSEEFGGDCVHALQGHVISGMLHGTPVENAARDYLKVIEIEEAIYASGETGAKIELTTK